MATCIHTATNGTHIGRVYYNPSFRDYTAVITATNVYKGPRLTTYSEREARRWIDENLLLLKSF